MIADRYTEERIRSWLLAIAPESTPNRVLEDTFDQTRHMAQASRSRSLRALTLMPRRLAVATAVAVVLVTIGVGFGRIVPNEGPAGPGGPLTSTIDGAWLTDENIAVTIERDPADTRPYHWRAAAYDRIDVRSLGSSGTETVVREPAARVFEGMADDVDRAGLRPFSFTVTPGSSKAPTILSPATPLSVDRRIRVTTVGPEGYFATLDVLGGGAYSVTALVDDPTSPDLLTAGGLRAAGTDYPAEIVTLYTAELPGVFGPNLDGLKTEILRTSSSTAPFDLAQRLVTVLQDRPYTYDVDVRDVDCGTMSTAECFVASKRGYCEHYAATMAVILRSLGVPARVVEGFLPGERVGPTEVIRNVNAHAWVEVYFPGFEWVTFDPTGGTLRAAVQAPFSIPP
jgi:hypothetical protein